MNILGDVSDRDLEPGFASVLKQLQAHLERPFSLICQVAWATAQFSSVVCGFRKH